MPLSAAPAADATPEAAVAAPRIVADPTAALRRVVIVKLSSLGDVVCALPLLEALRTGLGPDVFLGWAVRDKFADLLRGNPHLSEAYLMRERGAKGITAFGRELRRAQPWDAALDAQGLLVSGVVTRLSGAPLRVGLDRNREGNRFFLTHAVVPGRHRAHIVEKLLGFCDALGIPRVAPRRQAYLADGEAITADELLAGAKGGPRAGFIVGASRADKAWPVERWAEAARLLADQGLRVVLLGGSGEKETAARIAEQAHGAVSLDLTGRTTPRVLASVLARCAVVVGGDSGPTHLAVAVGAPVVGLYGVTDPALTGPCWGPGPATVLDYAEADAPPEQRRPRHTTLQDALARIPAQAAASAALALLDRATVGK
jgi:heptosyltransferase-1